MNRELKSYVIRKIKTTTIFWVILLVAAAALANYLPNIVSVSSIQSKKELPVTSVATNEKRVSLTFDAAAGNENTARLLEILAAQKVKATFFLTGGWVEAYQEDVKAIYAAGHEIANHSENHKSMSQLSAEEQKAEIMKVHNRVSDLIGYEMNLFRPPYEDHSSELIETAKEAGYHTVQWNVDSLDWKEYGAAEIVSDVMKNERLGNGSIIRCSNDAKYIIEALEDLIASLKGAGYEIVKLSELMDPESFQTDEEGRQITNFK